MTVSDHAPLGEVKNKLSEVVDRVAREHARVVITKHGRPAAVILSVDDLESLEETLAVMSDPVAMAAVRESQRELAEGGGQVLTKDEAAALVRSRGR